MKILFLTLFGFAASFPKPDSKPTLIFDSRIIGGTDVNIADYNYQASLRFSGSHTCGAIILSENKVLNAAHCLDGRVESGFSLWVGSNSRTYGGELIGSLTYENHEDYQDGTCTHCNDISMITLGTNLQFNSNIGPGTLPSGTNSFTGESCDITGWGRTGSSNVLPDLLKGVAMDVITNSECETRTEWPVGDGHICIYTAGIESACMGDSGGPMTCQEDGPVIAGITSWGIGDAQGNCDTSYPSVYTRVSHYIAWINERL